jgi:hypothetical protein
MRLRARLASPTVPPAWRRYLEHGDYLSGPADLEVFLLAGQVLRGRLGGLRVAWDECADGILAEWDDDEAPFAQRILEGADDGDWRGVLAILNDEKENA